MKSKIRDAASSRGKKIARFVAPFVILYLVTCALARCGYPKLLYPAPAPRHEALPPAWRALGGGPNAGPYGLARDGAPARAPLVVWFHGNGELCEDQIARGEHFAAAGIAFAAMEYRGYGKMADRVASEEGIYEDAEAFVSRLETEAAARGSEVVIVGYSLGSAIAAEMALRGHGARLVLVAPFTSMRNMGRRLAPFLPISLLMTERYDTLAKAPRISQKALVIHGDADELVPFVMGEAVARALPNATFVPAVGAHHAGVFGASPPALAALDAFVKGAP